MRSVIRFTVVWLAAWCQVLVVATMPLAPLAMAADPLGDIPICHAPNPADGQQPSSPEHGQHECALCVVCCQMHASPMALLPRMPSLPARHAIATIDYHTVQPRAPPFLAVFAAQPRGPPSLI
jgi:DUF2946 family protein